MSTPQAFALLANGTSLPWAEIPEWPGAEFIAATADELDRGGRLVAWFGVHEDSATRLVSVIAFDTDNTLAVGKSAPIKERYPSLTLRHPQAHLFEREVWEQHGLVPDGHPWLKPVRRQNGDHPAVGKFFEVAGSEVHEVAVGPVHAGIIEPGHFRFQCNGEEVLHLEIALGYQHRGVEEALAGGPHRTTMSQMEAVAGDTTIGHSTAYATTLEALGGTEAPLRAQWLRAIALELERLANHTGDLGALANDVAFLPTSAACGKIRGDFLNMTAMVCGNRFGRGLIRSGGCRFDLDEDLAAKLLEKLRVAVAEVDEAAEWLWDASSVRSRFEGVGAVSTEQAMEIGLVGLAARASGLLRDVRYDHPAGWHRFAQIPVSVWPGGDVFARARVRWLEIQRSGKFIEEQLAAPPDGEILVAHASSLPCTETSRLEACSTIAPETFAVSLVEGWRGEICHAALTDSDGKLRRYKIIDPSFHNWTGLSLAMRGQAISDFPICNKGFNLSYCGFDL